MGVDSRHPDYQDRVGEWRVMRDTVRGPTTVTARGKNYLPMPSGFNSRSDGDAMYSAYQTRAQFPHIVWPTIRGMVGVIHRIEAEIALPEKLKPMKERATRDGLTLDGLHRRITAQLLTTARHALLVDAPKEGADLPFIADYTAESLINWSEDRDLYVLDESGLVRNDFDWTEKKSYRVLRLVGGRYVAEVHEDGSDDAAASIAPQRAGNAGSLEEIPLVVIGATELTLEVEDPPLMGVANCALAAYRLDADYRYQLFMSGQETLVCSGIDKKDLPTAVGAGVVIGLPTGGHAEYVGPSGVGIDAHRTAIKDELERAVSEAVQVFEGETRAAQSGEALELKAAGKTANLTTISKASAAGLEKALRYAAMFVGANPEEVIVKPNMRFIKSTMTADQAEALTRVWQGAAISKRTLHENLLRGEIANPDRTFEQEEQLIEEEQGDLEPAEVPEDAGLEDGSQPGEDDAAAGGNVRA